MCDFPVAKQHPTKYKKVICPHCDKSNYKPHGRGGKCWNCGQPFGVER